MMATAKPKTAEKPMMKVTICFATFLMNEKDAQAMIGIAARSFECEPDFSDTKFGLSYFKKDRLTISIESIDSKHIKQSPVTDGGEV